MLLRLLVSRISLMLIWGVQAIAFLDPLLSWVAWRGTEASIVALFSLIIYKVVMVDSDLTWPYCCGVALVHSAICLKRALAGLLLFAFSHIYVLTHITAHASPQTGKSLLCWVLIILLAFSFAVLLISLRWWWGEGILRTRWTTVFRCHRGLTSHQAVVLWLVDGADDRLRLL